MWGPGDRDVIRPEFGGARRAGEWRRALSFVTGQPTLLLPSDLVRGKVGIPSSSSGGIRETEIAKVIGSVNRYDEFDREFLPRRRETAERWTSVRRAFEEGPGFPPIKVNRVGEAYVIVDGNHRVSVAKRLGMKRSEAEVTRFEPTVPIDEHTDVRSLIAKAEYSDFLRRTGLDNLRPGRYAVLLEHIEKHRYFKSLDDQRAISYNEAVMSWYDNVYRPLVDVFRSDGILASFPGRTEADLYVWASKHLLSLREQYGHKVSARDAVRDFAERHRLSRALHFLERFRGWRQEEPSGAARRGG
jgi:hypothetical protein